MHSSQSSRHFTLRIYDFDFFVLDSPSDTVHPRTISRDFVDSLWRWRSKMPCGNVSTISADVLLLEISFHSSRHSTQPFAIMTIAHDPPVINCNPSISNRIVQIWKFQQRVLSFAVEAAVASWLSLGAIRK